MQLTYGELLQPDPMASPIASRRGSDERQMFHIFRQRIVPNMLDIFDRNLWSVVILRASNVYPSLWHAIIATATAKHISDLQQHGCSESRQETILCNYALRHCNTAFYYLRQIDPALSTPVDWEMLLLTCIVLIQYTLLRGNSAEALTHISNGLNMSSLFRVGGTDKSVSTSPTTATFATTIRSARHWFRRLEVALRMAPIKLAESMPDECPELQISPAIPFNSLEDAYWELLSIDVCWKKIIRTEMAQAGYVKLKFLTDKCKQLQEPFQIWQDKLLALQKTMKPLQGDEASNRIESIRRLVLRLLNLTLEALIMVNPRRGELAWDEFNDNFAGIVSISEKILGKQKAVGSKQDSNPTDLTASSQFRSLIGLPLMATGAFCRVPHIRAKSLEMMRNISFEDGVFNSDFFARTFLQQKRFEEEGCVERPFEAGCICIRGVYVCNDHRVCQISFPISFAGQPSKVVFRTTKNVEDGEAGTGVSVCDTQEEVL